MRRKDSKYLFSVDHLPYLLEEASKHYSILEIEHLRTHNYQTIYYDTPGKDMYLTHHRGIVNRHKIRFRRYGTSNAVFLEVKKKDSKGVTVKNRMKTGNGEAAILSGEEEFLSIYTPYDNKEVFPVLENSFNRITLVSSDQTERITLDYNLWFSNLVSDLSIEIPGISIAEIKYGTHLTGSPFHAALRSQHVIPRRFSKYCIGMAI